MYMDIGSMNRGLSPLLQPCCPLEASDCGVQERAQRSLEQGGQELKGKLAQLQAYLDQQQQETLQVHLTSLLA